jgi:hypothetical protein
LHLSHPGLDVVEGQVRDRLLQAVKIHDDWLVALFKRKAKDTQQRKTEGCSGIVYVAEGYGVDAS